MSPAGIQAARLGAALYYGGLRAFGATALRRRVQDGGLILCYHDVVSGDDGRVGDPALHVTRDRFERQARWLAAHYQMLSLGELVRRLTSGGPLRGTAAITFDDGYTGVFDHALPVLRRLGIPATVFVVAEAPGRASGFWWDRPEVVVSLTPARRERWLKDLHGEQAAILSEVHAGAAPALSPGLRPADWETISAHLGDGIDVGVHSATHRSLTTLSDAELDREIVASRAAIHRATGVRPEFFAYPYGLSDPRVRGFVHSADL